MTATTITPPVSSHDRIGFTLLLALAAHALIILGLGFELASGRSTAPANIEIILTNTQNPQAPENAKVIAQHNQLQSGSIDTDRRPASDAAAEKPARANEHTSAETIPQNSGFIAEDKMVIHKTSTEGQLFSSQAGMQQPLPAAAQKSPTKRHNVAKLISELRDEKQLYAERPRINHTDTLSAKSALEASYIRAWVEKVEMVGNINYPGQARRQKLSGALILSVLVNSDGRVLSLSIQQSSGKKLLDDNAKKVVRLSSPFKEFPQEMRAQYEQIMITRTWIYQHGKKLVTR